MHARDLVELAAFTASHSASLIETADQLSAASIEQYWVSSKCRLERWTRALHTHEEVMKRSTPALCRTHWQGLRGTVEEVLTSEILTRVWAGVMNSLDAREQQSELSPLVRSVFIGHMEARNRTLTLLLRVPGGNVEDSTAINRLRRRVERWADLLLGYVMLEYDVSEFAFDRQRASDFAEDLQHEQHNCHGQFVWPFILATIRSAFRVDLLPHSPNEDLNRSIAGGVMSCLSPSMFDSFGLTHSLWQVRMANMADDAQGLIEDLIHDREPIPAVSSLVASRWPGSSSLGRFGQD